MGRSAAGRTLVTEAVEPLAEGIDREMAGVAEEVLLRQTGAVVKLSDHCRPIVVAGRQSAGWALQEGILPAPWSRNPETV